MHPGILAVSLTTFQGNLKIYYYISYLKERVPKHFSEKQNQKFLQLLPLFIAVVTSQEKNAEQWQSAILPAAIFISTSDLTAFWEIVAIVHG